MGGTQQSAAETLSRRAQPADARTLTTEEVATAASVNRNTARQEVGVARQEVASLNTKCHMSVQTIRKKTDLDGGKQLLIWKVVAAGGCDATGAGQRSVHSSQ